MEKAVALANNDVVLIAWSYEKAIPGCLGFAIRRHEANGVTTPLPAWVGFHGESNPDWDPKDTEDWPIQKFFWRDLTATWGSTYTYEIVPRRGEPGNLTSADDRRLITNEVTLTPTCSPNVSAYFNRGILSTQALAHALPTNDSGEPDGAVLVEHIEKAGDPIRKALAGQIVQALALLLRAAVRDDSNCHGALYELNDPELVQLLLDPAHVTLVLSDAGKHDATNHATRVELHEAGVEVTDRMMSSGHIGHNKFLVKLAPDGTPTTVLSGSTNWTYTGLCAQANNAILLTDKPLAEAYRTYWGDLQAESQLDPPARATQSDEFRARNDKRHNFTVDGAEVGLWFSPNTKRHTKPKEPPEPPAPSDMTEVFELIENAKQGVLFLLFQPGSPNILKAVEKAQEAKPELFVRGAATDPDEIEKYEAMLYHRTGRDPEVAAAAVPDDPIGSMQKELLKTPGAHAIIHDKIVVIDPRSDDCAVITGSHNLGYRASYANDENLLIVKGHRRLAEAYATHVMDIYDHYRWRWQASKWEKAHAGADPGAAHDAEEGGGLSSDDSWQAEYFGSARAEAERSFWL